MQAKEVSGDGAGAGDPVVCLATSHPRFGPLVTQVPVRARAGELAIAIDERVYWKICICVMGEGGNSL